MGKWNYAIFIKLGIVGCNFSILICNIVTYSKFVVVVSVGFDVLEGSRCVRFFSLKKQ